MFAELFILLYVAHLLADYPFQTDHQAENKAACTAIGWKANLTHAGTHVLVSAAALSAGIFALDLPLTIPAAIAMLLWIGASHSAIDRRRAIAWWMRRTGQSDFLANGGAAHVDQTAHLTALALASLAVSAL
jgi:Protein of unknown function (DUF3307)